jgi:hypothetical protein
MDKLTGFQGRTMARYERMIAMRYFIVALFRLEIITGSDLEAIASRNCELINHEIMWSFLN